MKHKFLKSNFLGRPRAYQAVDISEWGRKIRNIEKVGRMRNWIYRGSVETGGNSSLSIASDIIYGWTSKNRYRIMRFWYLWLVSRLNFWGLLIWRYRRIVNETLFDNRQKSLKSQTVARWGNSKSYSCNSGCSRNVLFPRFRTAPPFILQQFCLLKETPQLWKHECESLKNLRPYISPDADIMRKLKSFSENCLHLRVGLSEIFVYTHSDLPFSHFNN